VVIYNSKTRFESGCRTLPEKRGAERQVFGFDLPTTEAISRAAFREKLQEPLLAKLESWACLHLKCWTWSGRPAVSYSPARNLIRCALLWRAVKGAE
jgi:hypothetical protein